jgi:membrane protease YdiL (CAAX protease family)
MHLMVACRRHAPSCRSAAGWRSILGMKSTSRHWSLDPRFLFALLAACVFWVILVAVTGQHPQPAWPIDAPLVFLYPALVYPVIEEWLFRGLLQGYLQNRLKNQGIGIVSYANLLTSLLFSALHLFSHPPLWAGAVLVPSLIFGYFKDRTGRLGAPIALHVFYNGGYFWLFGPP